MARFLGVNANSKVSYSGTYENKPCRIDASYDGKTLSLVIDSMGVSLSAEVVETPKFGTNGGIIYTVWTSNMIVNQCDNHLWFKLGVSGSSIRYELTQFLQVIWVTGSNGHVDSVSILAEDSNLGHGQSNLNSSKQIYCNIKSY